jgi:hypothetical protein
MSEIADLDEANDPDHGPGADKRRKQCGALASEWRIVPSEGVRGETWADAYKRVLSNNAAQARQIEALRKALTEARGWVQDEVNADHRHRGEDVLERIDAALSSPSSEPAEAMRAECAELQQREAWLRHPPPWLLKAAERHCEWPAFKHALAAALNAMDERGAALKGNGEGNSLQRVDDKL